MAEKYPHLKALKAVVIYFNFEVLLKILLDDHCPKLTGLCFGYYSEFTRLLLHLGGKFKRWPDAMEKLYPAQ